MLPQYQKICKKRFNPLDRGNLNQMKTISRIVPYRALASFNPLDRGNLNQILGRSAEQGGLDTWFQSPKSGKFESNDANKALELWENGGVSIP